MRTMLYISMFLVAYTSGEISAWLLERQKFTYGYGTCAAGVVIFLVLAWLSRERKTA